MSLTINFKAVFLSKRNVYIKMHYANWFRNSRKNSLNPLAFTIFDHALKKIKCDDGNDIIYLDNTRMT